ncbi:permease [Methanonatronarchaeum sp. AMET6-2]|uniref:permease n=1 Tax=Methanonatronarchaeum sp. AMET6-2 TaxID=2933293 RepID=UPI00121CA0B6|nr:permease [Methanonatronarchaeum sp. AMET6-2]RZN61139.1 MAG: permease [Methanonatronarchaeia archaeon]UOY09803.1 permease [Methanonatronarchaeum sp. AMET6-2]
MIPTEIQQNLQASGEYFLQLAIILIPLFIIASFIVGLIRQYLPPEKVEQKLKKHDEGKGNIIAAFFGSVTPFCSCSTVPILAGLLQAGAPVGLSFAFLLSSPLVNWIAIILLFGLFGLNITILYIITTFTLAIIGSLIIGKLGLEKHLKDIRIKGGMCSTGKTDHKKNLENALNGSLSFFWDMLPYLIIGMVIGGLIHGVVPENILDMFLGEGNPLAIPLAVILGAPVYISMEGMLPIAAALADTGLPIGTVLAFVIGGAGVSIPNVIMLNKLFDKTLLAVYVTTVVFVGMATGIIFNLIYL